MLKKFKLSVVPADASYEKFLQPKFSLIVRSEKDVVFLPELATGFVFTFPPVKLPVSPPSRVKVLLEKMQGEGGREIILVAKIRARQIFERMW